MGRSGNTKGVPETKVIETRRPTRDLDVLHLMYQCVMIVFV